MTDDEFWSLIDDSAKHGAAVQSSKLRKALLRLGPRDVLQFHQTYEWFVAAADIGDLYGAGSLINGSHCSDDTFLYFRNWLVARGRKIYESAITVPDSLAILPKVGESEAWDEDVASIAYEVFEETTGKSVFDEPSELSFGEEPDYDWQTYAPELLEQRFPALWKVYGDRFRSSLT